MFVEKYEPNTQKALFHKDVVSHIRKWIKMIEDKNESNNILFLLGPVSSGKTVSVNVLFKGFNVDSIDASELRSNDNIKEIATNISSLKQQTLVNIDKWNHKSRKDKPNIVVIDNIELCEKTIVQFVEEVHFVRQIKVPIVLICNNVKLKDLFSYTDRCTYLQFPKPSLLELTKLASNVNKEENLKLSKHDINSIISKSECDIRQLLYLLEQWKYSSGTIKDFLDSVEAKYSDVDLTSKLLYFFDNNVPFHFEKTFQYSTSEPMVISCGVFQNYPKICDYYGSDIHTLAEVADSISSSNMLYSKMYEDQQWDLFDLYAITSCTIPSYLIKNARVTKEISSFQVDMSYSLAGFKDISYNFINSFEEIRKMSTENMFSPKLNNNPSYPLFYSNDVTAFFSYGKMLHTAVTIVTVHFENNKKGKNTTKTEKITLCKGIEDSKVQFALDFLAQFVFEYKLFTVDDIDNLILNILQYKTDDDIIKNVDKINVRILKRILNIFTFEDTNKLIKSHVEMAIKYKVFKSLIEFLKETRQETKERNIHSVDNLIEDLSNVWTFLKK